MSAARSRVLAARALLVVAPVAVAVSACAARQVEVSTGAEPAAATAVSLEFTNNLPQAVNVYLRSGTGSEVFVRQVPGRSTETVPVRGVRDGATVQLRIAPVDGSQMYTRVNVVVGRGTVVRVP